MRRSNWLIGVAVAVLGVFAFSTVWAEIPGKREFLPQGSSDPMLNPRLPMIMVQGGDTLWVNAHSTTGACPGSSTRGGEATGGPDGKEVWCFEGGAADTTSVVGSRTFMFNSYERIRQRDDNDSLYWHVDTFQPVAGKSMWCGGFNNRCNSWVITTGGYGTYWHQLMELRLGPVGGFNVARGCSLQFRTHYVVECNYDYAHLEYYSFNTQTWKTIDNFNGKSGCTVVSPTKTCHPDWNNYRTPALCPGSSYGAVVNYPGAFVTTLPRDFPQYPYVGAGNAYVYVPGDSIDSTPASRDSLRFRWRMTSDMGLSTEDGNAQVKGIWVDEVVIRTRTGTGSSYVFSDNFESYPVGSVPGAVVGGTWAFPPGDPLYDGWAVRYDMDPPNEGFFLPSPGDSGLPSACELNASWQWSITPNGVFIPPPDPTSAPVGYHIIMTSPTIPLNYSDEEGGPFSQVGAVFQFDGFQNMLEETCDYTNTLVRVHKTVGSGPWAATGAWCPWNDIDGFITYGGGTFWNINTNSNVTRWTAAAGLDSVQFAWTSTDTGNPGDSCWNPSLPPHVDSQYVVDNISVGLVDGSASIFASGTRQGLFQDTFNLRSCMHSSNLANNDLRMGRYLLFDYHESLEYSITDPNGLVAGNVKLHWSTDKFTTEKPPINMNLSVPNPVDPTTGGTWRTTICDTPWVPCTEISYFLTALDNLGNTTYFPASAAPDYFRRAFLTVRILPCPGAKILVVDDFGRNSRDYHSCRNDTVTTLPRTMYEDILKASGYQYMVSGGYDRYVTNDPSSNQRINEPWGFWTASPDSPAAGSKVYDIVIYNTGPQFRLNTIQDTTQIFLKQYVFHGGKLLVTGDRIGENLADPTIAQDADFYGNLLGAEYSTFHASGFVNGDRFAKKPASPLGVVLLPGDSLHIFSGCDYLREEMDRIKIKPSGLPSWSHPSIYLRYEDTTAPYDSVAGIYNFVTFTPDTGKVVYLPFSIDAITDRHEVTCTPPGGTLMHVKGRGELLQDVLSLFGATVRTAVPSTGSEFVNALYPAQPNPFNPTTTLKFSLASRSQLSLTVFDVSGRRVRTLVNDVREAGPSQVFWDGRNDDGRPVASGLYFARMEVPGFSGTQKLTLLK